MPWCFLEHPFEEYERNPIKSMVAQVLFSPVLRIETSVLGYQDSIRSEFPLFQEGVQRSVSINQSQLFSAKISERKMFQFGLDDWNTQMILTRDSLTMEVKNHTNWDGFKRILDIALQELEVQFGPINPSRVGVRYVNQIDKDLISAGLGRKVDWSDLITEDFLRAPKSVFEVDDKSSLMTEIHAPCKEPRTGAMNVKFGHIPLLVDKETPPRQVFRLDVDRYMEKRFDFSETQSFMNLFRMDAYQVFRSLVAKDLEEWMKPTSIEGAI